MLTDKRRRRLSAWRECRTRPVSPLITIAAYLGAAALAAVAAMTPHGGLGLKRRGLTDRQLRLMLKLLADPEQRCPRYIYLDHNEFTDSGVESLIELLQRRPELTEVDAVRELAAQLGRLALHVVRLRRAHALRSARCSARSARSKRTTSLRSWSSRPESVTE